MHAFTMATGVVAKACMLSDCGLGALIVVLLRNQVNLSVFVVTHMPTHEKA